MDTNRRPEPEDDAASALIVTHNSREEVIALLDSLRGQTALSDVVVVDNASSDGTAAAAQALAADFPVPVRVLTRDMAGGFAAANNLAASAAAGRTLLILNPDLVVEKGFVAAIASRVRPGIVVAPRLLNTDGQRQSSVRSLPRLRHLLGLGRVRRLDPEDRASIEQPSGAALGVSVQDWGDLGGMDEAFPLYYEDVDFCRRVIDRGLCIEFCGIASATHHGGRSSRRNQGMAYGWACYGRVHYAKKHFGRSAAVGVLAACILETVARYILAAFTDRFASPVRSDWRSYVGAVWLSVCALGDRRAFRRR